MGSPCEVTRNEFTKSKVGLKNPQQLAGADPYSPPSMSPTLPLSPLPSGLMACCAAKIDSGPFSVFTSKLFKNGMPSRLGRASITSLNNTKASAYFCLYRYTLLRDAFADT